MLALVKQSLLSSPYKPFQLNELYPYNVPELDLALNTGMRQGEQYNLTWENVDLERRLITIPRSKHGGSRHVELNDAAVAALFQAHARGNGSDYVFLNCYGQKLSSRASGLRRL